MPVVFRDPQDLLQGLVLPLGVLARYGIRSRLRNRMVTWGVEADYIYRMHAFHKGAVCEWMFGVRYLEFNEEIHVDADGRHR